MERRKEKRLILNVPLHIEGVVSHGDVLEEETFSGNISRSGVYFLSNSDYEIHKTLDLKIHLSYPLSNGVAPGDYDVSGTITRCVPASNGNMGQSESQWIAVAFHYPLPSVNDRWGTWRL